MKKNGRYIKYIPVTEVDNGVTYELEPDREHYFDIEKRIAEYRRISKNTTKLEYVDLVKSDLKGLRSERKDAILSGKYSGAYNLEIGFGRNKKVIELNGQHPSVAELKKYFTDFRASLSSDRKTKRTIPVLEKNFMGMRYKQTGGVFTEKGSILNLVKTKDRMARIRTQKAPHQSIPASYFGIEMELIVGCSRETLEQAFVLEKLDANIHVKGDGSIRGVNPGCTAQEVTVLVKESDLTDVMTRVCKVLKSYNAYVNSSCGGHVHVDCRKRNAATVYKNLCASLPLLSKLVATDRLGNRYCQTTMHEDFDAACTGDRYTAVNATAFSRYKTIEVRFGNASVNANDIIHWCKLLAAIADQKNIKPVITSIHDLDTKDKSLINWTDERETLMRTKQYTTEQLHAVRA